MSSQSRRSHDRPGHRGNHLRSYRSLFASVGAVWLGKLAKHLALMASLMILGRSGGHSILDPLGIFVLILLASLLHCLGRVFQQRLVSRSGSLTGPL